MLRFLTGLFSVALVAAAPSRALEISEFLARGADSWVELHHPTSAPLDLTQYNLRVTDEDGTVAQPLAGFRMETESPYTVIPLGDGPGKIALRLPRQGGQLELLDPEGAILSRYLDYPEQRAGVSYGREDGAGVYFLTPTPGKANGTGLLGFVADTKFSVDGGIHDAPVDLEITSETEEAVITYTTDGSVPSIFNPNARIYTEPVRIESTAIIRAMATKFNHVASDLDTHTYLFIDEVLQQPDLPDGFPPSWGEGPGVVSPLPRRSDYAIDPRIRDTVYTDMDGEQFTLREALTDIPSLAMVLPIDSLLHPTQGLHVLARNKGREWERPLSLEYFDENGQRAFQVNGGLRMQGGWNRFPEMFKKSFRYYFRSEYGDAKLDYGLFPDSPAQTFDTLIVRSGNGKAWPSPWRPLAGSTNNSLERTTYLRDQLPRDLQHDMGHPTAHGRFVHLYLNGLYWGLYNLVERVDEWFGPAYYGGDEDEYDVIKWIRSEGMVISAGDDDTWNDLLQLVRGPIHTSETYEAVQQLLDVENLIDYMLINFYIGNTDWPDNNSYTFRKRSPDGRFRFVCWDSEESLVGPTTSSLSKNNPTTAAELFRRLLGNSEFRVLLMDRIHRHFFGEGMLTDTYVHGRLMERAREIDRAIVGESARWGDLLRPQRPYDRDDWMEELENLEERFFGFGSGSREASTLDQMRDRGWTSSVSAPVLTPSSGAILPEQTIRLSKKTLFTGGTLYYTMDGTDPRLPGGDLNAHAAEGPASFSIDRSTTVKARLFSGGKWGPLSEAHFRFGRPPKSGELIFSEIMYHPLDGEAEFLELANVSQDPLNLSGLTFSDGIAFTFTEDSLLQPGAHVVLTNDRAAFTARYGGALSLAGEFQDGTRLSNGGETLTLIDEEGNLVAEVTYDDSAPWPEAADGEGYSLVAQGTEWQLSQTLGGTPGRGSDALPSPSLFASPPRLLQAEANLTLTIDRWNHSTAEHPLTVQVSNDLITWSVLEVAPPVSLPIDDERSRWAWTLPTPASYGRYVRLISDHP